MGLDIVMLGSPALREMKDDPLAMPELRMVIQYCVKHYLQAGSVDIKDPEEVVASGHRVGAYSDLHLLRGLALAIEQATANLAGLAEPELAAIAEAFYAQDDQDTTFPNLINHPDDSGLYVPFELPMPMIVRGVPAGYDESMAVTFGSSVGLLEELNRINDVLEMSGDLGEVGESGYSALAEEHRWPTIAHVWGVLRLYAREPLERPGFVQFC